MIDCLEINEAVMQLDDRLNRLSKGQLEVLRLVDLHHNSKEIAAKLGISSHTVDQRVRGAIRLLGVSRRSEAARMVGEAGPGHEYQRLIHQAPDVDADHSISETDGAVSFQIRHADRAGGGRRLRSSNRAELGVPSSPSGHAVEHSTQSPQRDERRTTSAVDTGDRNGQRVLRRHVPCRPGKLRPPRQSLT